ncbi:hypothetical protein P3X46_033172 [Hevea brasiliensis]|uniref:Phospholipase A1 n=2 Tax=Hevea brasiliensis TaxID=3981 RepID=A0ABQ9KH78_HEVBR|nr:hypothetical protein P3X46_033172 [Hevea brasiliensis]
MANDIATNWKVLSGEKNWEDLLDPIDDNLRRYLIRYGQLTGTVGDAFNDVKVSDAYALCRYPPEAYFTRTGIQLGNPFKYQVTDYFYGRSEIHFSEWTPAKRSAYFGFVAVATDEGKLALGRRDIVVCWRGTVLKIEWFKDFDCTLTSASDIFPNTKAKVHHGFHGIYATKDSDSTYNKTSAREQVLGAVRRLVDKYAELNEEVSITVTGHSLGAALATLNAMDIAANGYNKPSGSETVYPVTAFVYASPRVGDKAFREVFTGLSDLHLLRLKNNKDIVPDLPVPVPIIFPYEDVGVELYIDTTKSPSIKHESIAEAHDLNLYLHGVAGYQGKNAAFNLVITDLDIALVNKHNDLLTDDRKVPPKWWSNVPNKGMIQIDIGFWKLNDYIPDPPSDDASENGTN